MDEDIKRGLKKLARSTEIKVAESILRWKYKKEGKRIQDEDLDEESKRVADHAREVITRRGKGIWDGFKEAYKKAQKKEDSAD